MTKIYFIAHISKLTEKHTHYIQGFCSNNREILYIDGNNNFFSNIIKLQLYKKSCSPFSILIARVTEFLMIK